MAEETARATRRTPKAVIPERFAQGRRDGFAAGYPAGHTEGLEGLELDWSAPACDRAISGHYDDGFAIGFSEGFLNGHRRGTALR
jgi:flagellar biosynthesis/type III secretory pathway protein FliH